MRSQSKSGTLLFLLSWLLLWNVNLSAQTEKELDRIIRQSTLEIYENPDKVITLGKSISDNAANSPEIRIKALMLIANAYSSKRDYQKVLFYSLKANDMSKGVDNPLLQIKVSNATAKQYQQIKIYDKAIEFLDESESLCAKFPIQDSVYFLLGNNFVIRGMIYKEKLNCDIAINYFDKGINEYSKVKSKIKNANLSIAFYNKGNCYILVKDYTSAKSSFVESIRIGKIVSANSLQAFAQKGLAEVYTIEGKYENAIAVLEDALINSNQVGDLVLNQGIYKGLAENYLALNKWDKYKEFNTKYLQTQIRVKESERKSISDSLDDAAKINSDRLQAIIPKLSYGIIAILFALLLAVLFFILAQRKSRKSIAKLQETIDAFQKSKTE